jgi:hypothetical protein
LENIICVLVSFHENVLQNKTLLFVIQAVCINKKLYYCNCFKT